ncbi:MAG TPA: RNA polymerase subunit sigma-24 [Chthoniobacterales bacterium]|nr:RNA polymerase subunit sigma-24 [Chthoniobacterales bacterium]
MKAIPGTLQEGGAAFQATHWTLVLRARETQSDTSSQKALSDFCEAYWPPLYAFVRHRGHASPEAQDLVQGFFAHVFEQNTLSRAYREKGKLRTFLLGSFQNFLFNEYDRARALKRGGGRQILSIDEHLPEAEASMMVTMHLSDSAAYDLVWASNIVKRAWQQLESAFEAEGKTEWLEVLRPFVAGGGAAPLNQEEAAQKLGVPIATLRTWLSRLRQRYREALRMEVSSTVSDPTDVDQELHYLYQLLTA